VVTDPEDVKRALARHFGQAFEFEMSGVEINNAGMLTGALR
jgi:hypothetical protein